MSEFFRMLKKQLKRTMVFFIGLLVATIFAYLLFVNFYPSLGGDVSKALKQKYATSENFRNGKFVNRKDVPKKMRFRETIALAYKFFTTKVTNGKPEYDLEVEKITAENVVSYNAGTRLIWYGHSAFLLQIAGKNLLLDPMFGQVAAPHPWLGTNRFNKELPLAIEDLPPIDAIILSHDHYDHLDYQSIMKLKNKVKHYFVPLGVGVHLKAWAISPEKITELDWWEEATFGVLNLALTPAQHFSGRKFSNGQSTLWGSWVIQSENENIFFSGDSGYGSHFAAIGEKYGPFDLALMECGQYNPSWADIHMAPEETAQAGVDVKAKRLMPIHWAGFKLALHSWTDPVERVSAKAKALNLPLITPKIGEKILLKDTLKVYEKWWLEN